MRPYTTDIPAKTNRLLTIIIIMASLSITVMSCHHTTPQSDDKPMNTAQSTIAKEPMQPDGIVRLSKIEVYPEYLDAYLTFATEVGATSLLTEPGVLTMYAVADNDSPTTVTILETYSSQEAYRSHIASPHFQKYKQGTLHMVKSLTLTDVTPLNPANRLTNFIVPD